MFTDLLYRRQLFNESNMIILSEEMIMVKDSYHSSSVKFSVW